MSAFLILNMYLSLLLRTVDHVLEPRKQACDPRLAPRVLYGGHQHDGYTISYDSPCYYGLVSGQR